MNQHQAQGAGLTRREALQRILVASALAASLDITAFAAEEIRGIGYDPDLMKKEIPWPRVLSEAERRIVTVLGDILVPEDEFGPAASAVGVTDFIDEWVSAPYPTQRADLKVIRDGLAWIDGEARARYGKGFTQASEPEQTAILEDILKEGSAARGKGYRFFKLLRDRVVGGYYSTKEGWRALGYTGNVPSPAFEGPPAELLGKLGLA